MVERRREVPVHGQEDCHFNKRTKLKGCVRSRREIRVEFEKESKDKQTPLANNINSKFHLIF